MFSYIGFRFTNTIKLCSVLFGCDKQDPLMRGGLRGERTRQLLYTTASRIPIFAYPTCIRRPRQGGGPITTLPLTFCMVAN